MYLGNTCESCEEARPFPLEQCFSLMMGLFQGAALAFGSAPVDQVAEGIPVCPLL